MAREPVYFDCCQTADDILALQLVLAESWRTASLEWSALEEPESEPLLKAPVSEGWTYVVWKAPEAGLIGIHCGSGAAWAFLDKRLGGYSFRSGHRLRRAPDVETTVAVYASEREYHNAPAEPRFFHH